jgi:hypothetical protein
MTRDLKSSRNQTAKVGMNDIRSDGGTDERSTDFAFAWS